MNLDRVFSVSKTLGDRSLLAVIVSVAVISAGLIVWIADDALLAAGFAAATVVIFGLLYAASELFPKAAQSRVDFDWSLVREAADNGETAIAPNG